MSDIFISYSRKDSAQALELADRLRSSGMNVWIDQNSLAPAESWSKGIVDAIDQARAFIVLLSTHSIQSREVARELSIASESRKCIVPVALEEIELLDEFRYHLAGIQRINVTQFDALCTALSKSGVTAFGDASLAPTAIPSAPRVLRSRNSLMILPFEDISPTNDNGWFADGLMSELIDALTKVKSMRIIDRQTSMLFRTRKVPLRELAQDFDARFFIEGSVRKFGEQIKISIALFDVDKGDYLWQTSHKGVLADIFEIQETVAANVVDGLKLHLSDAERTGLESRGTENTAAYELYLKGQAEYNRRTQEGYSRSRQLFSQALTIDPAFGPAHLGLARALTETYRSFDRDESLLSEAERHCELCQEVAPRLASRLHMLSTIRMLQNDFAAAGLLLQEYETLEPDTSDCQFALGFFYNQSGDSRRAVIHYERAVELRPSSFGAWGNLVLNLEKLGEFERSAEWARKALPVFENYLRINPDDEQKRAEYALMLWSAGEREHLREYLRKQSDWMDASVLYTRACLEVLIGEHAHSIATLNRSIDRGFKDIGLLRTDDDFDAIRDTDEFKQVLLRLEGLQVESKTRPTTRA